MVIIVTFILKRFIISVPNHDTEPMKEIKDILRNNKKITPFCFCTFCNYICLQFKIAHTLTNVD